MATDDGQLAHVLSILYEYQPISIYNCPLMISQLEPKTTWYYLLSNPSQYRVTLQRHTQDTNTSWSRCYKYYTGR